MLPSNIREQAIMGGPEGRRHIDRLQAQYDRAIVRQNGADDRKAAAQAKRDRKNAKRARDQGPR